MGDLVPRHVAEHVVNEDDRRYCLGIGIWVSTGGSKPNRNLSLYSVMLILGLTECGMF